MFARLSVLIVLVAAATLSASLASANYMMPGAIGNDGSNGFDGSITAYGSSGTPEDGRIAQAAVDGSGMTGAGSEYSAYGYGQVWQSTPELPVASQWIKADFGKSYLLDHAKIWNSNVGAANRGLYEFDLYVSNAAAPGSDFTDSSWTKVNSSLLTMNYMCSQATDNTPQTVSLGSLTGRWVGLAAASNYGNGYPVVGISEIQFWGTAVPIPEPSTMVLLGSALLGLLAYAWRKRK